MTHGLMIGCYGYDHPQWVPDPYADDLPPAWRFCYYSNEVRSVVLPSAMLGELDDNMVHAWGEDSDEDFWFILELSPALLGDTPQAAVSKLIARLTPLADKIPAAMVREPIATDWVETVQTALGERIVLCTPSAESRGQVWYPQRGPGPERRDGMLLALVDHLEPRQLRSVIERLQQQTADCGLFFHEPETAWQQALQAQQLADLMGVARN